MNRSDEQKRRGPRRPDQTFELPQTDPAATGVDDAEGMAESETRPGVGDGGIDGSAAPGTYGGGQGQA